MANASNSNMNIPNTFNLTGTWQNNIEPLNSRNNPQQLQPQQNTGNLNTSSTLQQNTNLPSNIENTSTTRQNNPQNQNRVNGQLSLNNPAFPQNFTVNPLTNNNTESSIQANSTPSSECINCQNENTQTLANFAKSQIGKNTTIEFLLGENTLIEKSGTIVSVGENYILLNETGTRNLVACDLKNIKFIYFEY